MTTEQITEYLNKYIITTKELLAEHILQLKRNTKPNVRLISELVWILNDKFSVLNYFSAKIEREYKHKDFILDETRTVFENFRNILLKQDSSNVNLTDIAEILTAKTKKKFFKVVDKIKISEKTNKTKEVERQKTKSYDIFR